MKKSWKKVGEKVRKKVEKKFRKSLEKLKEKLKKVEEEKNEKNEKKNLKKNWKNFNFFQFFFSPHYPDQMSEGYQVSKVTLCVKILKWHLITQWPRVGIELPGQLKRTEEKLSFFFFPQHAFTFINHTFTFT